MTVLFWDIDGTLITTRRAGMYAWSDSVKELTGRQFDLKVEVRTAGLTDYQIAAKTFELLGIAPDADLIEQLVRRYEELLPASLPRKAGYVLPNVREILEHLRDRPDVRSYLLTGNTRGGARAKLTYFGLMEYFADGAFAEDAGARSAIAARALQLARRAAPVAEDRIFVIGDTPHDIECAGAIGARTIAVATGGYTLEELQAYDPWRAFEELPAVEEFVALIDGERSTARRRKEAGGRR
ncbi:MAG: HAD family hydrolase [Acidobacteria bacterium]|nr:HAD family hydrolase [Acidobacteriota bacterium]